MISKNTNLKGNIFFPLMIVIGFIAITSIAFIFLKNEKNIVNKIYPNVYLDNQDFGLKRKDEIINFYNKKSSKLKNISITVFFENGQVATFSAQSIGLKYDGKTIAERAYLIGRSSNLPSKYLQKILTIFNLKKFYFESQIEYENSDIKDFLSLSEDKYNLPAKNALFKFDKGKVVEFRKETEGLKIVSKQFLLDFDKIVSNLKTDTTNKKIILNSEVIKPEIKLSDINEYGVEELIAVGKSDFTHSIPQRIHNLTIAASKFNGVLIPKGKEFSFIGGKINSKKVMARTDNIIADLTEGFEEIKKNVILPSRIILYDSDDLNDTATKILSHRWSSDFFIQIPKVDILSEDEVINGLMNIFGEQIKDNASSNQRENFGFIVNQDISEKNVDRESELPKTNYFKIFKEFKDKLLNIFKIKTKQNTFKYNLSGKIFIFIGIFIIIIGLFINEYFFHQAVLTLYLPTQVVEKNVKIDVGYRIASASADFTENINTTGKTEIGDKARGQVTIHNFDDKEKIFSKGTVLQTANLPFVLDADIKVASSTLTADGSAKLPGKNNGTVTASQIGTEGNISKSQRFSIEGLSSATFFAVNDSAFSGGSKKQVQTVSKKDQENLKESIIDKAKNKIPSIKISSDEIIASSLSETDFNKMIFSKEIGEEGSKLTLQATVNTTQYLYNKKTFIDKILLLLKPDINKDYNLRNENIIYTVNKISKDDKFLTIDAKIKAKAVINILPDEIKKSVLGKNESKINEILKSRFKIDGYNININEPLPIFKNYLPFFIKNINLKNSSL